MTGTYEVLEHTADVGLRLTGDRLEDIFRAAAEGLAELQDAWEPGEGRRHEVYLSADDPGALLAAWIDELLYLQEAGDGAFGGFEIVRASEGELGAIVMTRATARDAEGVGIKAATYHRLRFERQEDGWLAEIYLDV